MSDELALVPTLTQREKGRFVNFYCQRIRKHSKQECVGIMRIIDATLRKGVTPEQIQVALEHYEKWSRGRDQRFLKHIRSFFTAENIRQWQTPPQSLQGSRDSGLAILDKLDALLD
jgi:hypothetical protein